MTDHARRGGVRRRLVIGLVALVGATAMVVGTVSVWLVERSLTRQLVDDALAAAEFNLTVLLPAVDLGVSPGRDRVEESDVLDRFLTRGIDGVWVEFAGSDSLRAGAVPALETVSEDLRSLVASGQLAYEFVDTPDGRMLVASGRLPPAGPAFYFVDSAATVDSAVRRLALIVVGATALAVLLGALGARWLAGRLLRPVGAAGSAAERIAAGDLDVRLPVSGSDELGRLSASFNSMAASLASTIGQLEAARLRERRFVADVSHELRTPLTGLVNEAALLADRLAGNPAVSDDDRAIAALLDRDVTRLRFLVGDLLEMSRLDSDPSPPECQPVDLERFLAALVAERHPAALLRVEIEGLVATDRRSLERVVGNLLDNARLHATGSEVIVAASARAGMLHIEVADRGPGVPPDQLTALFDRFATVDPARGSGTGLGMAIAAEHTKRLGGEISAALRPGGGLSVTVRIPVAESLLDGDGDATSPRQGVDDIQQGAPS